MTTATETRTFQAETRELLDLMIHSLYSNKEIFLRELISNASDAIDRLRFAALTDDSLRESSHRPRIALETFPDAKTLIIDDNGIGMTRDEVISNIGTIARSGTREFAKAMATAKSDDNTTPELIGQFGVGFYSSFMVADEVVVVTRKAGTEQGTRWTSKGDGEYTIEDCEKAEPGTRITLHLRKGADDGDDADEGSDDGSNEEQVDYTQEWALREVIKRYSDFVEYPIEMDVERTQKVKNDKGEEDEDAEEETVVETVVINSMKPLWRRSKSEITAEEYKEFYHHVSHDWAEPLETIHFKAEGTHEYTALLYLPKTRPTDLLDPNHDKSRLALYVKRVFVMADCEELVPSWLRFVRGLVDSDDLPLNVSRETLQHTRQMGRIRTRVVKKVLGAMKKMLADRRSDYVNYWKSFGLVLKEGIVTDHEHRDELAGLSLFGSSLGADLTTLGEYVERMPEEQNDILFLTGSERSSLEQSPHLEAAKAKGFEVLFLTDPIDEWVVGHIPMFAEKKLVALDRGDADLGESDESKKEREEQQEEYGELLKTMQTSLDEYVKEVRLTNRLSDSPAVLVSGDGDMTPQMERILRASGQEMPKSKRVLELNPDHAVFSKIKSLHSVDAEGESFGELLELVYGQALLAEGSDLPNPARFAQLVAGMMAPGS
ncbi:MAG: molecular chaperone HtpG [Pseudohongiellaceae bacterium]|jgi:molecular chaperone HtpG